MMPNLCPVLFGLCLAAAPALGHGDHGGTATQKPVVSPEADWMTRHMAEEHHATEFDASSFHTLHDFDGSGTWQESEMLRMYGLMDASNAHVTEGRRQDIARELLGLLDADHDGEVSRGEFVGFVDQGGKLPDLGTGPGHHGDDEYEYEIHHWEKYHDENTKLEDLTHPEDIEHFKKHEEMEAEEERLEEFAKQSIIESNIPTKFLRRQG